MANPARRPAGRQKRTRKPAPPSRSRAPAKRPAIDVLEGRRPAAGPLPMPSASFTLTAPEPAAPVPPRILFAAWGLLLSGLAMVATSATAALMLGPDAALLPRDGPLREGFAAGAALSTGLGLLAGMLGGALLTQPARVRALARFACATGAAITLLALVALGAGGVMESLDRQTLLHLAAGAVAGIVVALALASLTLALRPFPHLGQNPRF